MRFIIRYTVLITTAWWFCSCEEVLIGEERPNTVLNNYGYFCAEFRTRYGLFQVKSVD